MNSPFSYICFSFLCALSFLCYAVNPFRTCGLPSLKNMTFCTLGAIYTCDNLWLSSSCWMLPLRLAGLRPLGVAFTPGWAQCVGCCLYTWLGSMCWMLPLHLAGLRPLGVAFTPGWAQAVGSCLYTWLGLGCWVLPLHLAGLKLLDVAFTPGWAQAVRCGHYTWLAQDGCIAGLAWLQSKAEHHSRWAALTLDVLPGNWADGWQIWSDDDVRLVTEAWARLRSVQQHVFSLTGCSVWQSILSCVNGSILSIVNGSILIYVNGSIWSYVNGSIVSYGQPFVGGTALCLFVISFCVCEFIPWEIRVPSRLWIPKTGDIGAGFLPQHFAGMDCLMCMCL